MRSDLWTRADRIVAQAQELPPPERRAFVAEACGGDAALRDEVGGLLAADREAEGFLSRPVAFFEPALDPDESGRSFGPYRLLRRLGRGGMGTVYLAEREDGHYRQRVALKVIRGPSPGSELSGRLRSERQALARLEHPHVARLYDGGTTDDGRPYLVMEYVDGLPIDVWCDRHRKPLDERLRLFQRVCGAVHHAHRNLLVHRDLKPANILVAGDGAPKLLDFGIVKPLDDRREVEGASSTRTGSRPMTPSCASPEQVRGGPITTATDVYALGVLLYRLLAGREPFRCEPGRRHELERRICEERPERPSAAVARPAAEGEPDSESVAASRGLRPRELRRRLAGDLDVIVGTAMRKRPERRYASAEQLAADVGRYLSARPLWARPDAFPYRLGKFARRNALAVAAGVTVLGLLVALSVLTSIHAVRIARERQAAELEKIRATQVSGFLMELFEDSDPAVSRGQELTVREVLDRGAERVEDLADQPRLRAVTHDTLGRVYRSLALYEEAGRHLERALRERRRLHGDEHPGVAESLNELAELRYLEGDYGASEDLLRRELALRGELSAAPHAEFAEALADLAEVLRAQGDYPAAEPFLDRALAMRRRLFGDRHLEVAASLYGLAVHREATGDFAGSEKFLREALTIRRELLGEVHPEVAATLSDLAHALYRQGRNQVAAALHEEALGLRRELYGDRHPDVATSLNDLALVHDARGDHRGAARLHREAAGIQEATLGDHPYLATSLHNLAAALVRQGDYAGAEPFYRRALELRRRLLGERHPEVASSLGGYGVLLQRRGEYEGAERYLRRALELRREVLGDRHPDTSTSLYNLAALLEERGDYAAAEPLYRRTLALDRELLGDRHPYVASSLNNLAVVLYFRGEFTEAGDLLRGALEMDRKASPKVRPFRATATSNLGRVLSARGEHAAAAELQTRALAMRRELFDGDHPSLAASLNELGLALHWQGDAAGAVPRLEDGLAMRRRLFGEDHPRVAESLVALARARLAAGESAAAGDLARRGLAAARRRLPPGHWRIAAAEAVLGASLAAGGRPAEAAQRLEASLAVLRTRTSPGAPWTREAEEHLAGSRAGGGLRRP